MDREERKRLAMKAADEMQAQLAAVTKPIGHLMDIMFPDQRGTLIGAGSSSSKDPNNGYFVILATGEFGRRLKEWSEEQVARSKAEHGEDAVGFHETTKTPPKGGG